MKIGDYYHMRSDAPGANVAVNGVAWTCCRLFDVADPPTSGIDLSDFDTVLCVFSGP